jgi:hypothetical protein
MLEKEEYAEGKRKAGRPPKYDEPTTTIAFRVPLSKVEDVKYFVKHRLAFWMDKKITKYGN